jgi:hypothetical protein
VFHRLVVQPGATLSLLATGFDRQYLFGTGCLFTAQGVTTG